MAAMITMGQLYTMRAFDDCLQGKLLDENTKCFIIKICISKQKSDGWGKRIKSKMVNIFFVQPTPHNTYKYIATNVVFM